MSSEVTPRPPKKARTEEEVAADVTPDENEAKRTLRVCRFRISNAKSSDDYGKDFDLLLLVEKHGLYDLVDAVFRHELTKLSGGDRISRHLWNFSFQGIQYDSDKLPGFRCNLCDAENPRILETLNLEQGQKGLFRGRSGQFKFRVEDVHCQDVTPADVDQYPKVQAIVETNPITASKDDNYLSEEEKNQAIVMRAAYVDFYNGDNDWKKDRDARVFPRPFIRCKPMQPEWSHEEDSVIGLFLKGGWKFKKSWTCGLQYAFLHRAESATSGRWYQLRKERSYMINNVGRGMNQDDMIVQAKRECKSMMQSTLEKGSPQPRPKPKSFAEIEQLSDEDEYELEMMKRVAHRRNGQEFGFDC